MMTRNIRKAISIVCAVALVLSLCVASLTGTSSAFKAGDTPTGSSVNLTMDNPGDISAPEPDCARFFSFVDDGTGNKVYQVDISAKSIGTNVRFEIGDGTGKAFTMAPHSVYSISMKLKVLAGSYRPTSSGFIFSLVVGSGNASSDKRAEKTFLYTNASASSADKALTKDTEWIDINFIYSNADDSAMKLYVQTKADNGKVKAWFDDIKIDKVDEIASSYTYTFKNADGSNWAPANSSMLAGSSYVGDDGLHFKPTSTGSMDASNTTVGLSPAAIYDGKANEQYLSLKSDTKYAISVKYKLLSGSGRLGVGYSTYDTVTGNVSHSYFGSGTIAHTEQLSEASGDWQYLNFAFDTAEHQDWFSYARSGTKNFGRASLLSLVGNVAGSSCEFLIDSVDVVEYAGNYAVMAFDANGGKIDSGYVASCGANTPASLPVPTSSEDLAFAGWYFDSAHTEAVPSDFAPAAGVYTLYAKWRGSGVKVTLNNNGLVSTVTMAPGTELSKPERPTSEMFFLGWYTDLNFDTRVTTVPDEDVTLYAKYNNTYLPFNKKGYDDGTLLSGNGATIVVDPDDPTNKVLKVTIKSNGRYNLRLTNYDEEGANPFELELNTTYKVSYRYKVAAGSENAGDIRWYSGDVGSLGSTTHRTEIGGSTVLCSANEGSKNTDWKTAGFTYTTGDTFYRDRTSWALENHLFFSIYETNKEKRVTIYLDDVTIVKVTDEIPEGAVAVYFHTNSSEVPTMLGYPGDPFQLPADPTCGGVEFIGWYTDKILATPFTATKFPDKNINLYAKWKSVDYKVDFTDFVKDGGFGSRYALMHDDATGNDYLDYDVDRAPSRATDSIVLFRFVLNKAGTHFQMAPGATYTVTFKYKMISGNAKVSAIAASQNNGWGTSAIQSETSAVLQPGDSAEWKTASFSFTATLPAGYEDSDQYNYLSIGINQLGHGQFDDFVISGGGSTMNIYGSSVIYFDTKGAGGIPPISGDPGDPILSLPTPERAGYRFGGWYTDPDFKNKFTATKFSDEESITLYASWILGRFTESYEDFPSSVLSLGVSGAYKIYNSTNFSDFDSANVYQGSNSIFRDGSSSGTRGFTICRDAALALGVGQQYTLTFYVKPTSVGDSAGLINLIEMDSNTGINVVANTKQIKIVGELAVGKWQLVSYTFTPSSPYIGISTTEGNDMYFDNFVVNLAGYTGSSTGDASVSPFIILAMVVVAAGALLITGKKVFAK